MFKRRASPASSEKKRPSSVPWTDDVAGKEEVGVVGTVVQRLANVGGKMLNLKRSTKKVTTVTGTAESSNESAEGRRSLVGSVYKKFRDYVSPSKRPTPMEIDSSVLPSSVDKDKPDGAAKGPPVARRLDLELGLAEASVPGVTADVEDIAERASPSHLRDEERAWTSTQLLDEISGLPPDSVLRQFLETEVSDGRRDFFKAGLVPLFAKFAEDTEKFAADESVRRALKDAAGDDCVFVISAQNTPVTNEDLVAVMAEYPPASTRNATSLSCATVREMGRYIENVAIYFVDFVTAAPRENKIFKRDCLLELAGYNGPLAAFYRAHLMHVLAIRRFLGLATVIQVAGQVARIVTSRLELFNELERKSELGLRRLRNEPGNEVVTSSCHPSAHLHDSDFKEIFHDGLRTVVTLSELSRGGIDFGGDNFQQNGDAILQRKLDNDHRERVERQKQARKELDEMLGEGSAEEADRRWASWSWFGTTELLDFMRAMRDVGFTKEQMFDVAFVRIAAKGSAAALKDLVAFLGTTYYSNEKAIEAAAELFACPFGAKAEANVEVFKRIVKHLIDVYGLTKPKALEAALKLCSTGSFIAKGDASLELFKSILKHLMDVYGRDESSAFDAAVQLASTNSFISKGDASLELFKTILMQLMDVYGLTKTKAFDATL